MSEFLQIAFGFPTILFTVMAFVCLIYWTTVFIGALDIDFLDLEFDSGADADLSGGVGAGADLGDGGVGAGADLGDGDVGAGADLGGGDAPESVSGGGGLFSVLDALRLRNAPLTITFSVFTLFAWMSSYFTIALVGGDAIVRLLTLVAAVAISLPSTAVATRPLRGVFRGRHPRKKKTYIGTTVEVRVGASKGKHGQAVQTKGDQGLLLRVRSSDHELSGGEVALIVGYDDASDTFEVEPIDELLGSPHRERRGKAR